MNVHEHRSRSRTARGLSRRALFQGAFGLAGAAALGVQEAVRAAPARGTSYTGIPLQIKSVFTPPGGAVGQSLRVTAGFGGTCYMVDRPSARVHIIDVKDPANPALVSTATFAGAQSASSVDALNQRLYVTDNTGHKLGIIDVSDPANPSSLGSVSSSNSLTGAWDVKAQGPYAYVACRGSSANGAGEDGKFTVVDVSDPTDPQIVAVVNDQFTPEPRHVTLRRDLAYVCDEHRGGDPGGPNQGQGSFQIFDISDPTNPVRLSRLATPELIDVRKSDFIGDTVIVNGRSTGDIVSIDVSDPTNPVQLDSAGTVQTQHNHSVDVVGGYAYIASVDSDSVTAWDISDPSNLQQVGSIATASLLDEASEVAAYDGHLYVFARGNQKLTILGPGGPADVYEVEDLSTSVSSGSSHTDVSDGGASSGAYSRGDLNGPGDWINYDTPVIGPGTYNVKVRYRTGPDMGTWQFFTIGEQLGAPVDAYSATGGFAEIDLGDVTAQSTSTKIFRFTVTGRNNNSTGYSTAIDYVKLTPK